MKNLFTLLFTFAAFWVSAQTVKVTGDLMQWHKITLDIEGPVSTEAEATYLDYAVHVVFTQGTESHTIRGYFAADGDAANTGAVAGKLWKVHFRPEKIGTWNYTVHFRKGSQVGIANDIDAGTAVTPANGSTGTIDVVATDKDPASKDLRGKGRLEYVDKHFLKYSGSGQWSIKAGSDSPENLLAYDGFDATTNFKQYRKSWAPHVTDWNEGDPTWGGTKGKGLIGALNYLSEKGMNVVSFLTMNIGGDDRNVFPYPTSSNVKVFDCSKLDQWEIVFDHAETIGLQLHFKTQESECENLLDGGALGVERKLYYNELFARFGHHLSLIWDLGEENGAGFRIKNGKPVQNDAQRLEMAEYFKAHDPYRQNIVIHTAPDDQEKIYTQMLGDKSELTGIAIQTRWDRVHNMCIDWINKSAAANKKWVVANDEQNKATHGVPTDWYTGESVDAPSKHSIRKQVLWGTLMAGGAGVEYYFGYQQDENDLTCQNLRSRDNSWDYCRHALNFFNGYLPFWEMKSMDGITSTTQSWAFAKAGEVYAAYLPKGGTITLDLAAGKTYTVDWYNPRTGGDLVAGKRALAGGLNAAIGAAPDTEDWVALVRATDFTHTGNVVAMVTDEAKVVVEVKEPASGCLFVEKDGMLIIEAESVYGYEEAGYVLVNEPVIGVNKTTGDTVTTNPTGKGYLQYNGTDRMQNSFAANTVKYRIKITNPGEYQFRWRNVRDPKAHADAGNDSWIYIEGDGCTMYGTKGSKFEIHHSVKAWIQESYLKFQTNGETHVDGAKVNGFSISANFAKAGEYTIVMAGRSKGHCVDRLVLYKGTKSGQAMNETTPESLKEDCLEACVPTIMNAIDFPLTKIDGFEQAYKDEKNQCLGINAGQFKDKFAAVQNIYKGASGLYDIKLTTLAELDGESSYKVTVDGKVVGTYQNPTTETDYKPSFIVWEGVQVDSASVVQVEFSSHTNGKIPENGGTAYSRGRWTKIEFFCPGTAVEPPPAETVRFKALPAQFFANQLVYPFEVAYSANEKREINVLIKDHTENIEHGGTTLMVDPGKHTVTINVVLDKTLEVHDKYKLALALRPLNSDWKSNIAKEIAFVNMVEGGTIVAATGITLDNSTASLAISETLTLQPTVAPADANNKLVTWASDQPAIATVNANGVVTAIAEGTATITATTTDGGFTATSTITVTAAALTATLAFDDVDNYLSPEFVTGSDLTVTCSYFAGTGNTVIAGDRNGVQFSLVEVNNEGTMVNEYVANDATAVNQATGTATATITLTNVLPTAELPANHMYKLVISFESSANEVQTEELKPVTITKPLATAIEQINREVKLYPVPAIDVLNITGVSLQQPHSIEVVSVTGQVTRVPVLNQEKGFVQANVSALPRGIYIVRLIGDKVHTATFVKQ